MIKMFTKQLTAQQEHDNAIGIFKVALDGFDRSIARATKDDEETIAEFNKAEEVFNDASKTFDEAGETKTEKLNVSAKLISTTKELKKNFSALLGIDQKEK